MLRQIFYQQERGTLDRGIIKAQEEKRYFMASLASPRTFESSSI
jgi:hypothetical protein